MSQHSAPITPLPIPPATPVIFFGGTFDPVHRAHVQLAAAARDRVTGPRTWIFFVPAACSPFKDAPALASDADRLAMLREALLGLPLSAVWTDELDRGAPSYWVDTLGRARSVLGDTATLRFLIGADQAAQFHRWKDSRQVLSIAQPIVLARAPLRRWSDLEPELIAAGHWSPAEVARWRAWFFDDLVIDASATEARAALAAGDPRAGDLLDPGVLSIIEERGLYRTI